MKHLLITGTLLTGLLLPYSTALKGNEISQEELERWFNSDTMEPPRYKDVNEGHLVFLSENRNPTLHHHHNSLTISPQSLSNGWIRLEQCHHNMDKVPAAQILFKEGRVKNIKITRQENIQKAWVEGYSVQMENITDNAVICLQADTHSLLQNKDGTYSLRNGPYMRRFLDGYYPIRVSLDLNFSQTQLELLDVSPPSQRGFEIVEMDKGLLHFDTVFEGKLQTEFHFRYR